MVLLRVSLLWRIRLLLQHLSVEIHGDVHKFFYSFEDTLLWQTFFKRRVHNVPQFSSLGRVVPVLAQKPADEHEVVHIVLAVQVGKLLIEVADGLPFGSLSTHHLVIHIDFRGNRPQVLIVQIHSVTKTLDGRLESPELDRVQLDSAFNFKSEVLLGASTLNSGHSITATASSHLFIQIFKL